EAEAGVEGDKPAWRELHTRGEPVELSGVLAPRGDDRSELEHVDPDPEVLHDRPLELAGEDAHHRLDRLRLGEVARPPPTTGDLELGPPEHQVRDQVAFGDVA